ncbi:hypothetical protein R3P38DRAFT_3595205 [Favolaschia claudopus]|uniref:Protein kinase domain-containing protein n=1 Tax=Favolaschia claudopus TaxID=2862362 RepID=A0AAW0DIH5_9AGAR
MSTLQLIWDSKTTYELSSWDDAVHYAAQIVRPLHKTKNIYMVRAGPRGTEPGDVCAVKIAFGEEAIEEMRREAGFYQHELGSLQGTVVPNFFGFWTGQAQGQPMSCIMLEYCAGPTPHYSLRQQLEWKATQAVYALHRAGVLHGDLVDGNRHHFIPMGHDVRIVDFSVAVPHRCVRGLSQRAAGHGLDQICGCPEVASVERLFAARRPPCKETEMEEYWPPSRRV